MLIVTDIYEENGETMYMLGSTEGESRFKLGIREDDLIEHLREGKQILLGVNVFGELEQDNGALRLKMHPNMRRVVDKLSEISDQ